MLFCFKHFLQAKPIIIKQGQLCPWVAQHWKYNIQNTSKVKRVKDSVRGIKKVQYEGKRKKDKKEKKERDE